MRRRVLGAAVVLLLLAGVMAAWRSGRIECGSVPMRVRGVVVDAQTGAPVEGARLTLPDPKLARAASSDPTGTFSIRAGLPFSYTTNWLGIVTGRSQASPFETVKALAVEREGFVRLVHGTEGARWVEQRDGEFVGTLEVGTIRLARSTRTLTVRVLDGQGTVFTGVGGMVWWADRPDAAYGTPVGVEQGVAVLKDIPATPVVLVALPSGF